MSDQDPLLELARPDLIAEVRALRARLAQYEAPDDAGLPGYPVSPDRTGEAPRAQAAGGQYIERLRAVVEDLPIFFAVIDVHERYIYANRAYAKIRHGVTAESCIGKQVQEILGAAAYAEIETELHRALSGETVTFDRISASRHPGAGYVTGGYVPRFRPDGDVEAIYAVGFNVATTVAMRRAVIEGARRLRSTMGILPLTFIEIGPAPEHRLLEHTSEQWHQAQHESLIGRCLRDAMPREFVDGAGPYLERAFGGATAQFDVVYTVDDQQRRDVRVVCVPDQDARGRVSSVFVVLSDVSELKAAQKDAADQRDRLRQIIDLIPHFVYAKDAAGRFVFANEAAAEMYGMPVDQLVGKLQSETHLGFGIAERFGGGDMRARSSDAPYRSPETRYPHPDGRERLLDVIKVKLTGADDGREPGILVIGSDVTEQRELEYAMVRQERLATLGRLAATVSHELRNPLASMKPSLDIVRRLTDSDEPRVARALGRLDRSISRCDRLIDQLLDYATNKVPNLNPVQLRPWIRGVVVEQHLPPGIELVDKTLATNCTVMIDPERMRRAVVNVWENACQAMVGDDSSHEPDSGTLTVSTACGPTRVELSITDSGPGFSTDALDKAFNPFFSTKGFGTGLGLTVVSEVLEQHGGGVEIHSTPGNGANVVLWLPTYTRPNQQKKWQEQASR